MLLFLAKLTISHFCFSFALDYLAYKESQTLSKQQPFTSDRLCNGQELIYLGFLK